MRFSHKIICLLLLTFFAACSKAPEIKPNALAEKWITNVKEKLPNVFCKDGMYFRECFQITEVECKDQVNKSSEKCLADLKSEIFKNFGAKGTQDLGAEGAYWGSKWGECTGIGFEKEFGSKLIANEKCKDPKNWIP